MSEANLKKIFLRSHLLTSNQAMRLLFFAVGLFLFLTIIFYLPSFAEAQEESGGEVIKERKVKINKSGQRVKIDFEDELVSGEKAKPDAQLIQSRKSSDFKKLIKLRENFIPEAKKGSKEFGWGE